MITVFTPTYNRAHLLPRLYESLLAQSSTELEWVIVDDGSADNTAELVNDFIVKRELKITFFKQQNKGKHKAINKGLDLAKGNYFFIVDSDDYLLPHAINLILTYVNDYPNLSGVVFRKAYEDQTRIGGYFPEKEFISNHLEKTYVKKIKGDLAEVYKTEILRECKFDEGITEKFCAEGLVWNRVAQLGGQSIFVDEIIYIAEYLEGGLSSSTIQNRRSSPTYASLFYKELAESSILPLTQKIRTYINFWRFAFFNNFGVWRNLEYIKFNVLGMLCLPLGLVVKLKDDFEIRKK